MLHVHTCHKRDITQRPVQVSLHFIHNYFPGLLRVKCALTCYSFESTALTCVWTFRSYSLIGRRSELWWGNTAWAMRDGNPWPSTGCRQTIPGPIGEEGSIWSWTHSDRRPHWRETPGSMPSAAVLTDPAAGAPLRRELCAFKVLLLLSKTHIRITQQKRNVTVRGLIMWYAGIRKAQSRLQP